MSPALSKPPSGIWLIALCGITLLAFAGNSLLGRAALRDAQIAPLDFAALRLASGAAMLLLLVTLRGRATGAAQSSRSRLGALWLLGYALPFALSYRTVTTGTGALLLFGCVQATMTFAALLRGESLRLLSWTGMSAAFGGMVYLVLPGVDAPPLSGALAMSVAGVSWGLYSLHGQGSRYPVEDSYRNFSWATLLCAPLVLVESVSSGAVPFSSATAFGWTLALLSGALTSGLGYALWYQVLPALRATTAATLQLSVPILATAAGSLFLGETWSLRIVAASALIIGGIGLSILSGVKRPATT